ncbi:hypothetical protein [Microbulbifer sp. TRSA007]|uniref:hypothetical protein n=1 Tax=Microbulbifer sp. TRSA007 TaxID=3243384 RepID=UPI00403924A5
MNLEDYLSELNKYENRFSESFFYNKHQTFHKQLGQEINALKAQGEAPELFLISTAGTNGYAVNI